MFRKNLNLNPAIFKIFIFYIAIYLLALFLKYSSGFENLIMDIEYRYLALINMICKTPKIVKIGAKKII